MEKVNKTSKEKSIRAEDELNFIRAVACAMIEQAVADAQNRKTYKRNNTKNNRNVDRESAIYFLESAWFEEMCEALGLPGDRIYYRAMSWECPKCGDKQDPWFSRSEPMGYFCRGCGTLVDEEVDA